MSRRPNGTDPNKLIPDVAEIEGEDLSLEVDDVELGGEELPEEIDETQGLRHQVMAEELSEDPVRLYLREIGQVKLLILTVSSVFQR